MLSEETLCGCGKPLRHMGMCSVRWGRRRSGELTGKVKRRFQEHFERGGRAPHMGPYHPAAIEGRTLFPSRRIASAMAERLLKSGEHSRKIGDRVTKGALKGCRIFTLTLEERATCPRACLHWVSCYGSGMPYSLRIQADKDLTLLLAAELRKLCAVHGRILVRLHVLGDFFSTPYVAFWRGMLELLPGLHVYGYTARVDGPIAREIEAMNRHPRCWIRFSNAPAGKFRAITLEKPGDHGAIVCPAQHHPKADAICCGSCALCWSTSRDIGFLRH